jgi:septum formation protein
MQGTFNKRPDGMPDIILASQSPRRKYLLEQAGISFTVIPSHFDESSIPLTQPENLVKILAEAKARSVAEHYPHQWIIGADTVVVIDGTILGKPNSQDEARSMLQQLSGRTHEVQTGYAILCNARPCCFSETIQTEVQFKKLTESEIEWYIRTEEPFDKAGAYAIQGLGTFLVKRINGSYTNVVGLPVCEVIEFFLREGIIKMKNI